MSYHAKIRTLEESYRVISDKISLAQKDETFDKEVLNSMKSQQSMYFDELRRLRKLQWEEDHERVNFDDDR